MKLKFKKETISNLNKIKGGSNTIISCPYSLDPTCPIKTQQEIEGSQRPGTTGAIPMTDTCLLTKTNK